MAVLFAALPALYAYFLATPRGASYLGFQYNTDDHMVYAAWMRQAMDGQFLFDNRFTTDPQPGLTIHLYFWLLGLVAKITGIPLAATLGRLVFTALFVPLLYRLVRGISDSVFVTRLAVTVTILGGGFGFLVWHNFGQAIVRPETRALSRLTLGALPTDVWQPEGFVFPSMLTNGLFMVSLCLILLVFRSFLEARSSWKWTLIGALSLGVLMNIHSYDVVIVAAAMMGLLVMQLARRQITAGWLGRAGLIACGTIPAALWFIHVLRSDPVFQARAATPTYSADFRQVFFGYVGLIVLGMIGLWRGAQDVKARVAVSAFGLLLVAMLAFAKGGESYFMSAPVWALCAFACLAILYFLAGDNPVVNLVTSWAIMGVVILYFPALFQRKLAEGLSVPWAILASLGFASLVRDRDRSARNLATVLAVLVLCFTSVRWLFREKFFIDNNMANTTLHPVFLTRDMQSVIDNLNRAEGPKTVLAMPGVWAPETDNEGNPLPDRFAPPLVPDLNPIISGLTGARTYAGHWSETPNYVARRNDATKVFLPNTDQGERAALLQKIGANYIVAPAPEAYGSSLADLRSLGEVLYDGSQFKLIRLK